mmetsp:Transcript_8590/g.17495  ORF Transcript_8590/g.17495 Transcript_8590/m.17495 type:complete len:237 (+) Transcript_8590:143-853(+)
MHPNRGARPSYVRSAGGIAVCFSTGKKGCLGSTFVFFFAHPSNDARFLQCLPIREAKMPRQRLVLWLMHRIQVDRCQLFVVLVQSRLPRQKEDARHGGWHGSLERRHREGGHHRGAGLLPSGLLQPRLDHVGLEHHSLQVHAVQFQCRELRQQHLLRHRCAHFDGVSSVGHNLGLHNRRELLALADGGVAREVVHALGDGQVRGKAACWVDLEHVAPLGEARPFRVCLGTTIFEVV